MITVYDNAVLEFLISRSQTRAERGAADASLSCAEGTAIFDELDSLTVEEFARIYAVYLVGTDGACAVGDAEQLAAAAGLAPLQDVARDFDLHAKLVLGKERWLRYEKRG